MRAHKLAAIFLAAFAVAAQAATYIITGSGTTFTATKGGSAIASNQPIQDVINNIGVDAAKTPCTIQFGNGTAPLNIGNNQITFDGTSGAWGLITLTGNLTSGLLTASTTVGAINLTNGVSIESKANLTMTTSNNSTLIYNNSIGSVNISEGTISVESSSYAIRNVSDGKVTISGTAKLTASTSTTSYIISNSGNGVIEILGGTLDYTYTGQQVLGMQSLILVLAR